MSKQALDPINNYVATTAPSSPRTGDCYFNSTYGVLFVYNGTTWSLVPKADYATTVTSATPVVLTATSAPVQYFTGSTAQTVTLPVVTTFLNLGYAFTFVNTSTASLTINSSGSNLVVTVLAGHTWTTTCILLTGTTAASWQAHTAGANAITGSGSQVFATSPTLSSPVLNTATGTSPAFTANSAATVGLKVTGAASQTSDLFEILQSGAVLVRSVTAAGLDLILQPVPNAQTASVTLTIANMQTRIITATSATAVSLTLPTGTLMDGGFNANFTNESFDWSLINLGSASGAVTLVAGTAHTIVGSTTVAIGTSSLWRSVRTAAATWVTYRLV